MIWTIAWREIVTRGRTKPYLIITAIMFLGVIAVAILTGVLTGREDDADRVAIGLESTAAQYSEALAIGNDDLEVTVTTPADGWAELADESIDVLFDGSTLIWDGFPDGTLDSYVRSTVQQVEFANRAEALELSDVDLGRLFAQVELGEERLDGDDSEFGIRVATAMASTVGTFMMLQIWGAFLMMGVIEEKSSRVVEVLLSHVKPRTLLAGKVLGLGILALTQVIILVAGMMAGLAMVQDITIPDGVWGTIPLLLVTFLLGYAFYASLFAAVGSTVSRQEDAQAAQLPAMLPLLVGYGIAMSSIGNADNLLVKIASFVPFTSPVVLPFRVAMESPPWWEVGLALAILAASVPIMLRIAGAIYRTTLLQVGARVPLLEAFRNRSD